MKKNNNQSAKIVMCIFALVIALMISNVIYIGMTGKHFLSGDNIGEYADSRGSSQKVDTLYAQRGTIYSSDGEVIASDVKKYKLYAILSTTRVKADGTPAYVVDKKETAKKLAPIIGMDEKKVLERLSQDSYQVEFGSYGNNLSSIVKDQIDALQIEGLEFEEIRTRNYRYGDFASYEVGYAQLLTDELNSQTTNAIIGQMGIEKVFDDELSGVNGKKVHIVDRNNYTLPNGVLSETAPIAGNDVYLTIDTDIQTELELQMKKLVEAQEADKATCAIMEAKTGRILAITNYPSFDPNERKIDNYVDLFLNEAVEPGSVFKTFVYANAINDGKLNVEDKFKSGQFYYNKNLKPINDHNGGKGWGTISFRQGFYNSSNTAICYLLTEHNDKESLIQDYEDLGFFQSSSIDGLISGSGVCGFANNDGRLIEYLTTGFGQGSSFTGIHLLRAYSAFANDGKTVEPHLVDKIVSSETGKAVYEATPKYSKQIYSSETVEQVRDLLNGVINIKGSTGQRFRMEDVALIGKTGTGQVAKDGKYLGDNYYTHSFAGLAPYEDPEIVIVFWYQGAVSGNKVPSELVSAVVRTALNKIHQQPAQEVETSTFVLDSFTNQSTEHVKKILTDHQLTPIIVGDGKTILSQYPKAKTEVSSQSRVFVQTDGLNMTMPSMEGWSRKEVEAFASMANLKVTFEGVGTVYSQNISKGTALKSGQEVKVKAK
jgi:Cell division protein FtsI/penicillin-binding protein 2